MQAGCYRMRKKEGEEGGEEEGKGAEEAEEVVDRR